MSQSDAAGSVVTTVVGKIHDMLASGELLPGHAIRQEALASRLGVSRAPVREALRIVQSEGILHHEPNVGYSVKRLTTSELQQTYLMRHALESELLRALPPLTEEQLANLERINADLAVALDSLDVASMRQLNHDFHFTLFALANMDLVVAEIQRIWTLTEAYRSYYLYDESARRRVVREHEALLEALRAHDLEGAVRVMDDHRSAVPAHLGHMLSLGD
ncbi:MULTISPECIES: GntR family transcriptional regulator [unclassified Nocardioides]|uniref:GntR family transcriptional regulator n=1 Tax=unclassified Nocardioides TaxID=2615069 RepID=UPI0009F11762|nr:MULTISPECIES: GntR family transcriptional regulator [unclassified Nocardioides]GAW52397.1 Transcriptional regulator, GntR family [Nocardioides sp. PD653-B2]GAW53933.1 Transcriptional regulator, GntR family [Nocardioides sp. PD653]